MREGRTEHYAEILDEVARQSSVCERRADEAERESDKLKKAEYMSYHLGEEFEGIISGVTGWGLYVELPNTAHCVGKSGRPHIVQFFSCKFCDVLHHLSPVVSFGFNPH